jgi:hypothetical protein
MYTREGSQGLILTDFALLLLLLLLLHSSGAGGLQLRPLAYGLAAWQRCVQPAWQQH